MFVTKEDLQRALPLSRLEELELCEAICDCIQANLVSEEYLDLVNDIVKKVVEAPVQGQVVLTDAQRMVLLRQILFSGFRTLENLYKKRPIQPTNPPKPRKKNKQKTSVSCLSPWEVLGVSLGTSREECHKAYLKKMRLYHPDKVASLPLEFQELATRLSTEINAAWDEISKK
jgi:hypothetical protein